MRTGLQVVLESPPTELRSARLGVLMNQASVGPDFRYTCDLLAERFPGQLKALFSPQHGFWCEAQANMIESNHGHYHALNLPLFSLYSETRRPTGQMLDSIDCLIIDLQDVGTRVYTFVWTLLECLRACREHSVRVMVLDRPNPLGGLIVEGPLLQRPYRSFVGGFEIPLRHGLTLGELALLLNDQEAIHAELTVVPMDGWSRNMMFADTGLSWVPPSPNMPSWQTAVLYPGQVLLEGTNLSEGRGTTIPFEVIGAPWLDPDRWCAAMHHLEHPGVVLQPIRFRPTFDKWTAETCGGLRLNIIDSAAVRSVALTVCLIATAAQLAPQHFCWLPPPYEYETEKPPIDILFGNDRLRNLLRSPNAFQLAELADLLAFDSNAWQQQISGYLQYS